MKDSPTERRFSTTRFSDESEYLALLQREADAINCLDFADASFENKTRLDGKMRAEVFDFEKVIETGFQIRLLYFFSSGFGKRERYSP